MEKKDAVRIQESILSKMEKKALIWMANRQPKWITSDNLTGIGLLGAFIAGGGYVLSNWGKGYLWLASFGFILNWYGDSLDGTLARVRKKPRPVYGFYLDHNVDAITALIICIGAGLSPYISFSIALLVLVGYFLLCIFTYINTYLIGTFKISYSGLGPTELRLAIIILNIFFYFFPGEFPTVTITGRTIMLFDLLALGVAMVAIAIYLFSFFSEKKKFEKIDPLPS